MQSNDRIAIVGRNGAGKSTLLKIMSSELTYDAGYIYKVKDLNIGYLDQQAHFQSEQTIWQEMLTVFTHILEQETDLQQLATKIDQLATNGKHNQKLIDEYGEKQEKFEEIGGYRYESDIKGVLIGLGFSEAEFQTPINELSGGQKTRIALGKLLLTKPDLLILDEPTNHLDIATLTWLENYLVNYPGAIVIVSHDRYFLDKIVNVIYDISYQRAKKYHGSYSQFLEQKAADYERDLKAYEKQQTEISQMEDFIQRNIARASTTKRAQSRRKQLARIDRLGKPDGHEASASFTFSIEKTSGNDVLKVENVAFRYPNETETIFSNASFQIHRGERIALIGPNGVGKSTLLKTIIGDEEPTNGQIQLGTNVKIGYYDQEQTQLSPEKTVLAEIWDDFPTVNEKDIRTVLGNFLFSQDDVLKHVHTLSGGEKARLALAKLMMQRANFLILDEPTNHLDLDSKEVLEAALMDFPGTILFVSHDRYFINKIADQVVDLDRTGTSLYLGNYDYYIEKKNELEEIKRLEQETIMKKEDKRQLSYNEQKKKQSEERKKQRKIASLEEQIEALELQLAETETKMTEPEIFQDHEKALEMTNEANALKEKIEQLMDEWAALE